jgi:hypothetical protein
MALSNVLPFLNLRISNHQKNEDTHAYVYVGDCDDLDARKALINGADYTQFKLNSIDIGTPDTPDTPNPIYKLDLMSTKFKIGSERLGFEWKGFEEWLFTTQ